MNSEDDVRQTFVSTETQVVDCLLEIIDSFDEWEWEKLGLDVYAEEGDAVTLVDFLIGEPHNQDKGATATINPMYDIKEIEENKREQLLIYFYLCISTIRNRIIYERMRKEDDDKKTRCDNDNKVGGTGRAGSKNTDNAERPLPDSQPSSEDNPGA